MLARLRADLHVHTREAEPSITYGARDMIVRAAGAGYRVLSITNHDTITYSDRPRLVRPRPRRAADSGRGGDGRGPARARLQRGRRGRTSSGRSPSFAGTARPEWLVAAPHPSFPASYCLREQLWQQIDLFDAIEFSHFYTPRIDFNRPAVKLAAAVGLPLLGSVRQPSRRAVRNDVLAHRGGSLGGVGAGGGQARPAQHREPPVVAQPLPEHRRPAGAGERETLRASARRRPTLPPARRS